MTRRRLVWVLLTLVLALAAVLRFYRIGAQSLWNDEGTSAALALRDLATITRDAAHDIHPPLYYWLLHFWVRLWGVSELALRSLSALLGVGTVALVFFIGEALFGAEVGLLAAFLAALSPFQVYYSQETRMYMLLATVVSLGTYALVRHMQAETSHRGERRDRRDKERFSLSAFSPLSAVNGFAVLYALAVAMGLYTHYSFPILWAVWNLAYLAFWLWQRGGAGRLARWAAIQGVAFAFYLPWLPVGLRQMMQWPAISEPHSLAFFVKDAFTLLVGGHSLPLPRANLLVLAAALGVVALAGLLPLRRESGARAGLPWWLRSGLVAAWLAVPVLAQWALSLLKPAYRPKFFLVCAPAFALLVARGALWPLQRRPARGLGRLWAQMWLLLAIVAVAGAGAQALQNYYFDPAYARDDYRGIARYIEAFGGPNDAVLINAPSQVETFTLYYTGSSSVYPLPRQRPLDKAATERDLTQMLAGKERVFAIFWATDESDPERFIESWMDSHAFKASDDWFGNVRFVVYAVPQKPLADITHPMDARLGDRIRLRGYSLLSEDVPSGGIVQITLFWEALAAVEERYKVFVHLLDAGGHVVGQRDAEPGGGAALTTTWRAGDRIADNYGVPVPPGTPPGEYRLEIGMYRLDNGARLPIVLGGADAGDHLLLDPIRVHKSTRQPPLSAIPMQKRLSARIGPLELGGVDVHKLGFEGQRADLRPGDAVHLTLFWRAVAAPRVDYEITIGDRGAALSSTSQPAEGRYPTSLWDEGEVVRDDRFMLLPADLPAGRYDLYLAARTLPDGKWGDAVLLCTLKVVR
ncbi:MAG: glycosyltransferase family 39 protein [Anaerolineae bacterium]|jgi:4-amino-4-deoxy-L-arabinose transferase-like glycosyltransferase|nr:glycosyltransferase family 39 protein [Anaerolineae bacterium]